LLICTLNIDVHPVSETNTIVLGSRKNKAGKWGDIRKPKSAAPPGLTRIGFCRRQEKSILEILDYQTFRCVNADWESKRLSFPSKISAARAENRL
jgi:hypothetical protein